MEVLFLDPNTIIVPERMRKDYGDLDELASSIKEHGQIHPILITLGDGGGWILIAGGRRLEACKKAGLSVAATVKENCSQVELKELELRENLDRKDMTWTERVTGISELNDLKQKEFGVAKAGGSSVGWSLQDTADLINAKSKATVHEAIQVAAALKAFPELKNCSSAKEAQKAINKMTEKLAVAELVRRKKENSELNAIDADRDFVVGDAFDGLKALVKESVDFINCDTPYGIDLTNQKKIQSDLRTDADYKEWSSLQYLENIVVVSRECFRALKSDRWMLFWYGQEWYQQVRGVLEAAGFKVDKIPAAWYGGPGAAQTMAPEVNLARCYEQFFVCRKGDPILVKRGRPNVFDFPKVPAQNKIHPTEKPLDLMKELYETFILPGAVGYSPFIGSGNDLRVGYMHGCKWSGRDLNGDVKNKFLLRVEKDIEEGLYGNR